MVGSHFHSYCNQVPPAAVTSGSLDGQFTVGYGKKRPCLSGLAVPLSPVAPMTVTRLVTAALYNLSNLATCASAAEWNDCSVVAKLWLMTAPGKFWIAHCSPLNMQSSPWTPCVSAGLAATSTRF